MTLILSQQNCWDMMEETAQTNSQDPTLTSFETLYQTPKQIGTGTERWFQFSPEFSMSIQRYQNHQDVVQLMPERPHEVELQIMLSGTFESEYGEVIGAGQSHLIGSGIAPQGHLLENTQPMVVLCISLEPQVLLNFLGQSSKQLPIALQRLTQTVDRQTWVPPKSLTPAMHQVIQQILHCPYQGEVVKQMYLQSKTFELLALHLDPILQDAPTSRLPQLKPQDIDRLHQAQEILLKQMENPPSLLALAKKVGLNDYKLKTGFWQVFGTTVFGYLLEQRLLRSQLLLELPDMTIAEIAWAVGFSSRSHFSTVFKQKFGVNPSDYRQGKRSA